MPKKTEKQHAKKIHRISFDGDGIVLRGWSPHWWRRTNLSGSAGHAASHSLIVFITLSFVQICLRSWRVQCMATTLTASRKSSQINTGRRGLVCSVRNAQWTTIRLHLSVCALCRHVPPESGQRRPSRRRGSFSRPPARVTWTLPRCNRIGTQGEVIYRSFSAASVHKESGGGVKSVFPHKRGRV